MIYWIFSGGLVLLGIGAWLILEPASPLLLDATTGYPYAVLGTSVLLAWRFQRSRVAWAAMLAGAAHLALTLWPAADHRTTFAATALLFPVALAGLAFADDRGPFSKRGLVQFALGVALPALLVGLSPLATPEIVRLLDPLRLPALPDGGLPLPRPALFGFMAGAVAIGASLARRRRPTEAGLLWALVAGLLMLQSPPAGPAAGAWLLAAGAVLALSVVESSYTMAYYDELTGLPARRALKRALAELRPPYAIAVADVDRFKEVNDTFGHEVGDQILRMIAMRLARVEDGRAYRSGGEEFTLVFPGLSREEARDRAEHVRLAVEASPFKLRRRGRPAYKPAVAPGDKKKKKKRPKELPVTISIGIAAGDSRNVPTDVVVQVADRALYQAKTSGRNRIAV